MRRSLSIRLSRKHEAADNPNTVSPVFTEVQSAAGAIFYQSRCAACHGKSLDDGAFAPPLTGELFLQMWGGKRANTLADFMITTMPPAAAGSLKREEVVYLLAFLLQNNRVRPSLEPLPSSDTALSHIVIPSPTNPYGEVAAGITLPLPPNPKPDPLDQITPVTSQTLRDPPDADWLTWRRTNDDGGFSPLAQINRDNVSHLTVLGMGTSEWPKRRHAPCA